MVLETAAKCQHTFALLQLVNIGVFVQRNSAFLKKHQQLAYDLNTGLWFMCFMKTFDYRSIIDQPVVDVASNPRNLVLEDCRSPAQIHRPPRWCMGSLVILVHRPFFWRCKLIQARKSKSTMKSEVSEVVKKSCPVRCRVSRKLVGGCIHFFFYPKLTLTGFGGELQGGLSGQRWRWSWEALEKGLPWGASNG